MCFVNAIISRLIGVAVLVILGAVPIGASGDDSNDKISYSKDVRPILSKNCFQCHGPDEHARKGNLKLDDRSSAIREFPTRARAIVPGHPEQSELIVRITSADPAVAMPPRETGKRLTPSETQIL